MAKKKCSAVTNGGKRCTKLPMSGRSTCWVHAEGLETERKQARQRGARTTNALRGAKLTPALPPDLTNVGNLMRAVEFMIRESVAERIDPKIATVVANLGRIQASLVIDVELERRLEKLETAMEKDEAHAPA